jgi:hypothetical protein
VKVVVMALLVGVLLGSMVSGRTAITVAQESSVPSVALHPIVGSWMSPGGYLFTFIADGGLIATDWEGHTYHGAWEAITDPARSAAGEAVAFAIDRLHQPGGGYGIVGSITVDDPAGEFFFEGERLDRIEPD